MAHKVSEELDKILASMPKWKKYLVFLLPLTASALIFTLIGIMFQFHGTLAMFEWIWIYKAITIIVGILGAILPFIYFIDKAIAKNPKRMRWVKAKTKGIRFPSHAFWTIAIIGLLLPIGLFSWVELSSRRDGDKPPQLLISDRTGIYGVPDMAVVFWTQSPVQTQLTWGYGSQSFTIEENSTGHVHVFTLANLLPNTTYWYSIQYEPFSHIQYNFTTPHVAQNQLKIAISSDFHISGARSNATASENIIKAIADPSNGFEMFFNLGDMVEYGFDDKNWEEAIAFFSNLTSQMPSRTIIGNHDAMIYGAQYYKDYFYPDGMPLNTSRGDTPYYFRIDINGIHFLLLDLEWGTSETYFGAQETWLKNQLQSINPDDWTIVMSHTFYYAKGSYSEGSPWFDNPQTIEHLVPLFEQYDVDMVFSGHIHDMQHLIKNNVSYSIIGGGGGYFDPDPKIESEATSLFFDNEHNGYIDLTFEGNKANLTYYSDLQQQLYSAIIYK